MSVSLAIRSAVVVGALLAAGCGGSSGGPIPSPGGGDKQAQTNVVFSIVIPNQTSVKSPARRAQYVSSNTHSMTLSVNGGAAQVFSLTPSTNTSCSVVGGATICSGLTAVAAPGTDSLVFNMYQDSTPLPVTPTLLSTTTVNNQVIVQGVANQLGTFTLNPVLSTLAMSLTLPGGGFAAGTASSGNAIDITAKDASGATILAPGTYDNASGIATAIGLTSSQTPFTFAVDSGTAASTGSLATAADTATLSYSGATVGSNTTITATAGILTSSQTISAIKAPIAVTLASAASATQYHITTAPPELDFYTTGITGTASFNESGYSGNFTLQSDNCNTTDNSSATGNYATFSPGKGSSATSFTVSAAAAGTSANLALCTATFGDSVGQTLSITFSVTTITFGLQ